MALLTSERHQYVGLETPTTIRILVLHPADNFTAPIQISFEHFDRDAPYCPEISSSYEAVSYCWGTPNFSQSILVNDSMGFLNSSPHVDSMLRHLRKTRQIRRLWIDALCINQTDVDEKAVQVRRMGRIYQEAEKVRVWLGVDVAFDAQLVFEYLKSVALRDELRQWAGPVSKLKDRFGTSYETLGDNVQQFLLHPWFGRRWILQEISLGRNITMHIGATKLSWEWFAKGIKGLSKISKSSNFGWDWRGYKALSRAVNIIKTTALEKEDLQDLLLAHASAECSDPNDRLYALYGIAELTSTEPYMPKVDYESHWIETYTKMAEIILSRQPENLWKHLRVFQPLSASYPDAPSWVPNYTRSDVSVALHDYPFHTGSEKLLRLQKDSSLLQISGWLYGPVKHTWSLSSSSHTTLNDILASIKCNTLARYPLLKYDTRMKKNLWRDLSNLIIQVARTTNPASQDEHGLNEYWYEKVWRDFASVYKSVRDTYDTSTPLFEATEDDQHVSNLVHTILRQKTIFQTQDRFSMMLKLSGHESVGIGEDIQEGDFVFLQRTDDFTAEMDDRKALIVVRPCSDPRNESQDSDLFRFFGFCFLRGFPHVWPDIQSIKLL